MEIPENALISAQSAYDYEPGHAPPGASDPRNRRPPMEVAILAALEALGFTDEWAVPCLDGGGCRTTFPERRQAEEFAERERSEHGGAVSVIEHRHITAFRPVP